MKKAIIFMLFSTCITAVIAQEIKLTFESEHTVDKIEVVNINNGNGVELQQGEALILSDVPLKSSYAAAEDMKVYPNPAFDNASFGFYVNRGGDVTATVYNSAGQTISRMQQNLQEGYYRGQLHNLASGMYIITVQTPDQNFSSKLISRGSSQQKTGVKIGSFVASQPGIDDSQLQYKSLDFSEGDHLRINAKSGSASATMVVKLAVSENIQLDFTEAVDVEGNVYSTVKIGDQLWMAENLRVTRYNDGTPIRTGLDSREWRSAGEGAYSIYPYEEVAGVNSNQEILEAFGGLYNWHAVTGDKGICPPGWRVPTDNDWKQLTEFMEGSDLPKGNMLKSTKQADIVTLKAGGSDATIGWKEHEVQQGTDDFGFNALPAGYRRSNGNTIYAGEYTYWWSSTEESDNKAWARGLGRIYDGIGREPYGTKNYGFSVRCIKE